MLFFEKYKQWSWILLLIPIYLFLFLKLGNTHMRLWDEGWYSVHAVEMWKSNSCFTTSFDGQPDPISSKPPLMNWLQVLCINVFGVNELAIRLPSAIASAITSLLVYFFVRKTTSTAWALSASMILLTSIGFIGFHASRAGDTDALLTLSIFVQAILVYYYFESKRIVYLYMFFIAAAVSFWIKSIAGLFFIPGFLVYGILVKKSALFSALKSRHFYIGLAILVLISGTYLILKEIDSENFISSFYSLFGSRYFEDIGHENSVGYYVMNMMNKRLLWWMPFGVIGILCSIYMKSEWSGIALYTSVLSILYIALISFSRSKLEWYDVPVYPFLAISSAFGLKSVLDAVDKNMLRKLLFLAVFIFPISNMFYFTQANALTNEEMNYESQEIYLRNTFRDKTDLNGLIVIHNHFNGSLVFYKHKFASIDQNITLVNHTNDLSPGDKVLIKDELHLDEVHQAFNVDTLGFYKTAYHLELLSKKIDNQFINHE